MPSSPANISADAQLYLLTYCFLSVRLHNTTISACIFIFQKKTVLSNWHKKNTEVPFQYQAFLEVFFNLEGLKG